MSTFNINAYCVVIFIILDGNSSPSSIRSEVNLTNLFVIVSPLDKEVNRNVGILEEVDGGNISRGSSSTVSGLSSLNSSLSVEED